LSSPTASLPEEKGDNYPELSDRTPRAAFDARDKARPSGPKIKVGAGVRVRRDRIDRNRKVTPFTRPPRRYEHQHHRDDRERAERYSNLHR
jgi:hypothetical protein